MMRIVDMMYAVPYLLIAILLVTLLGREFYLVVLTITVFSWMDMARVVRGQTLSLRSTQYVDAARALGVSTWRIILAHIVPNLIELNIGHSLMSRAIFVGLPEAIREMLAVMEGYRG
jgi:oligopeptide transport system permease protein